MRKYLLGSIIILIVYYISTFLISFIFLTKSVVNNDPVSLSKFINEKELRSNFFGDIYEFSSNLIKSMDKKIRIKNESIELTGELTSSFLKKLFFKMSNNISTDFSRPEIMLYFYFKSNEITTYLNKSFTHFGDYNFEKYHLQKRSENSLDVGNNEDEKATINNPKEVREKEKINLSKLTQRIKSKIKSADYFFLVSPIHFKIDVKHQDIPFIVILRFNGYIWQVQKIKIPYKELINLKNISFYN